MIADTNLHTAEAIPPARPGPEAAAREGWYAVRTRSNFEKRATAELARKDFMVYLPLPRDCHRWKDRAKLVERPLFPGYLFVRFSGAAKEMLRIVETAGAVEVVGGRVRSERVPDHEIDGIRALVASGLPLSCHPLLKAGAAVRVCRGPLAGLEGKLIRAKRSARLVVSIGLLSRSVAAEVDIADLEPMPGGSRPGARTQQ